VRWEGKGRRRSSSTSLNRARGRKARGACLCGPRPSRLGAKERETAPIDRGWLIALIGKLGEEGKEGEEAGRGGIRGCGGRPVRQRRRRKEGGEGETDKWGQASVRAKKKKKKKRERARAGAGKEWRAAGPLGPKGERVRFLFFFSFSNSFLKQLFFSNSNQFLSNFFSKIL
jgi:hypothetical protein